MTDTIGARAKALRDGRSMLQIDAAEAIGISRPQLSAIEGDKPEVSLRTLAAVADFYGVSIDWLYRGATGGPEAIDLVKDPNERALLRFWRKRDQAEQKLLLSMLTGGFDPKVAVDT